MKKKKLAQKKCNRWKRNVIRINNDEIAKTFDINFAEKVEKFNTFGWPAKNEHLMKQITNQLFSKFNVNNWWKNKKFHSVSVKVIEEIIKNIPSIKSSEGDIPIKILN